MGFGRRHSVEDLDDGIGSSRLYRFGAILALPVLRMSVNPHRLLPLVLGMVVFFITVSVLSLVIQIEARVSTRARLYAQCQADRIPAYDCYAKIYGGRR